MLWDEIPSCDHAILSCTDPAQGQPRSLPYVTQAVCENG